MPANLKATWRIAVLPGDGIGPEVMEQALRILDFVSNSIPDCSLCFESKPWGSDWYRRHGEMMPEDGLNQLGEYDALLFGAVGSPNVPDSITLRQLLLRIRFGFDQYINLRPARLFAGVSSPIGLEHPFEVVFIREGVEGEYAGLGGRHYPGTDGDVALQTSVFTRRGVERTLRWAFEYARSRNCSLTSVSKGNALQYTGVLWDDVFDELRELYPDVKARNLLVDAAAMLLIREPRDFEIVVGSNLFADILTDLSAGLVGGLGVAPSASLNPERTYPSTFEPVHGSAPDIAGQGIANPVGMIWSSALMLGHLGLISWEHRIVNAIETALSDPRMRTRDLGGPATSGEMTDAILEALRDAAHMTTSDAVRSMTSPS